ncbi:TRAP transporter small permease [Bacillus sp. REN10]|uniref:TRAP transporter small permease n=1 Tax=Bacillus sp. REN10 TaxID=2782541 RepID=UPI00193AED93|nr:TRAP transporter small permease [Bacillus sp. REN10]
MKNALVWLDRNFEPILMTILFYAMTILVTLQVILRFAFDSGFSWGEEAARFMFVWLMYFSISYATRVHAHIKVSFLVERFNEKIRKSIMIVVDLLFIVFSAVIFVSAISICQATMEFNDRAVTIDVSMNIIYGAGLIGFVLLLIRLIQSVIWKIKHFNGSMEYFENQRGVYTGAESICLVPKGDTQEGSEDNGSASIIR